MGFTAADMPDLSGKTALVTGSAGIAFEVCLQLAKKGARVLLALWRQRFKAKQMWAPAWANRSQQIQPGVHQRVEAKQCGVHA